jgi:hypothetical protein
MATVDGSMTRNEGVQRSSSCTARSSRRVQRAVAVYSELRLSSARSPQCGDLVACSSRSTRSRRPLPDSLTGSIASSATKAARSQSRGYLPTKCAASASRWKRRRHRTPRSASIRVCRGEPLPWGNSLASIAITLVWTTDSTAGLRCAHGGAIRASPQAQPEAADPQVVWSCDRTARHEAAPTACDGRRGVPDRRWQPAVVTASRWRSARCGCRRRSAGDRPVPWRARA